jgi:hypothetical protein
MRNLYLFIFILFKITVSSNAQTWAPVGVMYDIVYTIYKDGNNLYVGGIFNYFNGIQVNKIMKFDGTNWSSMDSGMDNTVLSIINYNNDMYASGFFDSSGSTYLNKIAKWNGNEWENTGYNYGSALFTMEIYDSVLFAAGIMGNNYSSIYKYDGTHWDTLGRVSDTMLCVVYDMTVYQNELYVAGKFQFAGGVYSPGIARWNDSTWESVGGGVSGYATSLLVHNNELWIGGYMPTENNILRWNGINFISAGSGMDTIVSGLGIYNNNVVAGGYFSYADGNPVEKLALWNGSSWSSFPAGGFNGNTNAFETYNNEFYAGGDFNYSGTNLVSKFAKVTLTPSADNFNEIKNAVIYFETSHNELIIELEDHINYDMKIELYDEYGKKVFSDNIINKKNRFGISHLTNGIYLYRIMSKNNVSSGKISIF